MPVEITVACAIGISVSILLLLLFLLLVRPCVSFAVQSLFRLDFMKQAVRLSHEPRFPFYRNIVSVQVDGMVSVVC